MYISIVIFFVWEGNGKKKHPKSLFVGKLNPHLLTKYVASTYEHYTKSVAMLILKNNSTISVGYIVLT